MQTETDKKDYILNIRISRALYDKVTKKAYENRETTSHLLRKIIEDSAEIVGDLSEELFHTDRHKKQKPASYYFDAVLVENDVCEKCERIVKEGESVRVMEMPDGTRAYVCDACRQ